jgi:hypothetical protein
MLRRLLMAKAIKLIIKSKTFIKLLKSGSIKLKVKEE